MTKKKTYANTLKSTIDKWKWNSKECSYNPQESRKERKQIKKRGQPPADLNPNILIIILNISRDRHCRVD